MARDGSGNYTRVAGPYVGGTTILKDNINDEMSDIATALSDSINKAGTQEMAANLPMGGFKLTGLAAGASNGDSVRYEQLTGLSATYQPLDATLTAFAGLATADDRMLDFTGTDTMALVTYATVLSNIGAAGLASANVFTSALQTVSHASAPTLILECTGAAADAQEYWLYSDNTGTLYLDAVNDARSVFTSVLRVSRSAGTPTAINFLTGALQSASVAVNVAGKQAIPVSASAMTPNTTNGAAQGTTETTTNKVMVRTLDFDTTTQEGAQFSIPMPKGWNEGTVTFQPLWTADSGSGTVVFELRGVALSDDDALDTAFGTGQTSTDTFLTAGDVHIGPESSAITIGGSPAEGDIVFFQIRRVPASDTLGVDARLISIRLFITTNAANDA